MQKVSGGLPPEYQQVEYIKSDRYAFINTGIYGKNSICATLDFQLTAVRDSFMFGGGQSASQSSFRFLVRGGQWWATAYGNNSNQDIKPDGVQVAADTQRHTITQDGKYAYFDGRLGNTFGNDAAFVTPAPLYIFRHSNQTDTTAAMDMKVYSCIIKDNNMNVRNFVPCYRISDNAIGMYDTIQGVFYTNANTRGSFFLPT